jgi:hypothetical protein
MGRAIAAVVAGYALWSVLWIGFGATLQSLFPELIDPTQPLTHTGVLLAYIAFSVVISIGSGWLCAAVRKENAMKAVWTLAIILLATGIGFEASYWSLMPVWYHLVFLALLVPATVWGGSLKAGRP